MVLAHKINSFTELQNAVLKYTPKCNHILLNTDASYFKNLTKTIVYLNLKNNMSFWYFIEYTEGNLLIGFRKSNNRWIRTTILISMITSFY